MGNKSYKHSIDFGGSNKIVGMDQASSAGEAVEYAQNVADLATKQPNLDIEGQGIEIDGTTPKIRLSSAGVNYDDLTLTSTDFSSLNGDYFRASVGGYFSDAGNQLDWTEDTDFSWYYKDNGGGVWAVLGKRDSDGNPSPATGKLGSSINN